MPQIEQIPEQNIEIPADWRRRSPARLPRRAGTPAICVRELDGGHYQLRSPWLRWQAVRRDHYHTLPCVVVAPCNDDVLALGRLALSLQALTEHSIREMALVLEVSFGHLAHAIRVAQLPDSVLERVDRGDLSPTVAKALIGLDEGQQLTWAIRAVRGRWSVRQLKKAIRQDNSDPDQAMREPRDANLEAVQHLLAEKLLAPVDLRQEPNGAIAVQMRFFGADVLAGLLDRLSSAGRADGSQESPGDLMVRFSDVDGFNQAFARWFDDL